MNYNILNIFKGIKLSSVVSNANTTLNVIKKMIPVYKEIKPFIYKNNKIKFQEEQIKISEPNNKNYNDSLTFFN